MIYGKIGQHEEAVKHGPHTSIAILDALGLLDIPVVEVHLSNIFRREAFRAESYVSRAADGVIAGFGGAGYELAVEAVAKLIEAKKTD